MKLYMRYSALEPPGKYIKHYYTHRHRWWSVWRELTVMRISSTLSLGNQPNSLAYALCDITQVMTVIKTVFLCRCDVGHSRHTILQFTSHGAAGR